MLLEKECVVAALSIQYQNCCPSWTFRCNGTRSRPLYQLHNCLRIEVFCKFMDASVAILYRFGNVSTLCDTKTIFSKRVRPNWYKLPIVIPLGLIRARFLIETCRIARRHTWTKKTRQEFPDN
jgi:hypothetical protein